MSESTPDVEAALCRTCLRPITFETRTEPGYLPREGWYDDLPRDPLVCFKAIEYRHVPLSGRERAYYDAGYAAALRAAPQPDDGALADEWAKGYPDERVAGSRLRAAIAEDEARAGDVPGEAEAVLARVQDDHQRGDTERDCVEGLGWVYACRCDCGWFGPAVEHTAHLAAAQVTALTDAGLLRTEGVTWCLECEAEASDRCCREHRLTIKRAAR